MSEARHWRLVDGLLIASLACVAAVLGVGALRREQPPPSWGSLEASAGVALPAQETLFTWADCDSCAQMIRLANRLSLAVAQAPRKVLLACENQLQTAASSVPLAVHECRRTLDADSALRFSAFVRSAGLSRLPALVRGRVVLYGAQRIARELEERGPGR
jgi:hypothetical protein